MGSEMAKELGLTENIYAETIEYTLDCIDIYRQTLRAMGIVPVETTSQTIDASQLSYQPPTTLGDCGADVYRRY